MHRHPVFDWLYAQLLLLLMTDLNVCATSACCLQDNDVVVVVDKPQCFAKDEAVLPHTTTFR
jgi:hypothetical protein